MAAGPLLVSEPLQRYRALGLAGDPVWRAAGQLRAAIASRLSREHADLLAVPEAEPSGRTIDWYAPFDGEIRMMTPDAHPGVYWVEKYHHYRRHEQEVLGALRVHVVRRLTLAG